MDCGDNIFRFVERHHVKPFLKFVAGVFRKIGAGFRSGPGRSATSTATAAATASLPATAAASLPATAAASTATSATVGTVTTTLTKKRLLCLETLRAVAQAKPEELARREVMTLMENVMSLENHADLKETAAKILMAVSKVLEKAGKTSMDLRTRKRERERGRKGGRERERLRDRERDRKTD